MTSNCHIFFRQKTSKKCDNLGTFTQKVAFLDYSKTKKEKKCDNLEKKCDNLGKMWQFWKSVTILKKNVTIWGHELYIISLDPFTLCLQEM